MPLVSKTFSQIITFTRASTATYFDATGTLQSAAIDAPRFDYDPSTLAAQGFLIEEARTNSIRNNTMVGAVAGTPGTLPTNWGIGGAGPGTLTQQIVGVSTSNGITYIDIKLSGTTSTTNFNTAFEATTQIGALSGQTWTESTYAAIVGGSTTNITNIRLQLEGRNSGGTTVESFLSAGIQGSLTSALQRFTLTSTFADATTAFARPTLRFDFSSGVAIDITLRIGLPQLEQGAFATSVIPTTTTALTRSADVASVNTLSPWYNATEGTFYAEGVAGSLSNSPTFVSTNDGTSNNLITSPRLGVAGLARLEGTVGGVAWTAVVTANATTANSVFKAASAFEAGDQAICLNGGTTATGANASLPAVTTVRLGSFVGNLNFINGYLRRITYYPRRLSNAELQAITA